jgi:hypothetical protein
MSAKREETREKRFGVLLSCSSAGKPVPPLRRSQHYDVRAKRFGDRA